MQNQSTTKTALFKIVSLLVIFFAAAPDLRAQPEEELIRGAKKEGQVVFWSSMRIEDSRALAAGFEAAGQATDADRCHREARGLTDALRH